MLACSPLRVYEVMDEAAGTTSEVSMDGIARELKTKADDLKRHHVPDLPARQADVLALMCFAATDLEIAAALGIALDTVRRHAQEARNRVVPGPYAPTRANAQLWSSMHLADCLATAEMRALRR